MDYSRQGVIDKQKSIRSVGKRLSSKFWITVFRLFIIVVVAAVIVLVMAGFGVFNGLVDSSPSIELAQLEPETQGIQSKSYYADGTEAQVFSGAEGNRIVVPIEDIPVMVRNCFVAMEDERFYEHGGIDIRGIFRAGVSVIRTQDLGFGGSTITQQLIKNMVFQGGNESVKIDKVVRKVQEQFLAIQLETVLSKDEILEKYLNYVNLGNGAYGVEAASLSYFGKSVGELTLAEASVLAPIALSPTRQNPITYPETNAERREKCLNTMRDLGMISQAQHDEALADDVYTRIAAYNAERKVSSVGVYSYFTDELVEQVVSDLQTKLGYTYEEAQNLLYYGGISIYTTQDPEIQAILDSYYTDESNFPAFGFSSSGGSCYELTYALSVYKEDGTVTHYQRSDLLNYFSDFNDSERLYYHEGSSRKGINELLIDPDDIEAKIEEFRASVVGEGDTYVEKKELTPQPQSSMSIIEQSTGKVVAVYGGRGQKDKSLTLNRATNTTRSVGSTFKVLASFLPAIDGAGLTLASVQDDSRYYYPGTDKEVINWYAPEFRGLQTIRTGIYNSLNIVAVRTLEQIGAPLAYEYLEKLGFSTLVKNRVGDDGTVYSDVNLAIALGGLTDGVTNLELTAAYAAIANEGVYNKPIFYTEIRDHSGNILLSNKTESKQVMKKSSAWLLTDAMLDTTTIGTGTRLAFKEYDMPVAGKTGTATKNNDLWFAGYTPYYTAAVWTGFDNNFNQINKTYQQNLWRNVMEEIHKTKQLEYKEWDMPDSIVKATICTKCGNLAVAGLCDEAEGGSCAKVEYFAKGTVPTQKCTCHIRVDICKKSKKLATDYCPEKKHKSVVLLIKDENYERDGEPDPCETWDTPYIYDPNNVCDYHLPDGMVVNEDGSITAEVDEDVSSIWDTFVDEYSHEDGGDDTYSD